MILRGVCELRRKERKGTYMAFLDVSKVYDTVWREGSWRKIQQYGVRRSLFTSVKGCMKGLKQVWCWKGGSQDGFQSKQGYVIVTAVIRGGGTEI